MSTPRAWVTPAELASAAPEEPLTVTGEAAHHLHRVLRLERGDPCTLFDGAGRVATALVDGWTHGALELRLTSIRDLPPLPGPTLELIVAVLKADKLDWVVQKLTELGVDRIVPVHTARSVARPKADSAARRQERIGRILREAARQCGRAHLPRLDPIRPLGEALAETDAPGELRLFCWEEAPLEARLGTLLEGALDAPRLRILIGPEGGLTAEEASLATAHGFLPASLGTLILRAETAAIAACALAASRLGRLG